jgi:multiple antibiotic resistance protein
VIPESSLAPEAISSLPLLNTAIGVIAVTDPIGLLPVVLGASEGDPKRLRRICRPASLTFLVTLLLSCWMGGSLLRLFSISLAAFRIAGGLILLPMGLSMLQGEELNLRRSQPPHDPVPDTFYAVVPIGLPIMAGPGTISLVISQAPSDPSGKLALTGVLILISIGVYLLLRAALPISHWLGAMGIGILTRIMGVLLTAIAVQLMLSGLGSAFPMLLG